MKKWVLKENKKTNLEKEDADKYHPVVLGLLAQRGLVEKNDIENFFDFDYNKLADPLEFLDMEKAVERIILAKEKNEKVAVFGDYDADGVTATALVCEALKNIGFKNGTCYIPDRQLEGYGMNEKAVEYLSKEGVNLIITVDCGISNFSEVEKAKELGMDVIITDHHQVQDIIPKAWAVINPNRKNSGFPSKDLAGVGVAFKFIQALYKKVKPGEIEQLKWMLDLVCIGTIADCVALREENRVLVKYGLIVLSKTKRVGLQEIFKVGRIDISENNIPDARKVAFQIVPRINATGRMDHANMSLELIKEEDRIKARDMALEVEIKNQQRQKLTGQIVEDIEKIASEKFSNKKIIIAENPHWPVGILGLVAGKITEEFGKPAIILQKQENGYVGSLRSIPEVNIFEALKECADLLDKFGGHSQAAGVKLSFEKAEIFFNKLSQTVERFSEGVKNIPSIDIDAEITSDDIGWELIDWLKKMEPFGEENKEPVFLVKDLVVSEAKIVGNNRKHLKLYLRPRSESPKIFDAIGFGMGEEFSNLKPGDAIEAVFNLEEDGWNGSKKIQLKLIDLKKI